MIRFVENVKAKQEGRSVDVDRLSVIEIASAERLWIQEVQSTIVPNASLKKRKRHLAIVEIERAFVFRRKLKHSDLNSEYKYRIYLGKDHRFTELIIEDCHSKVYHYMVNATLAECVKKILKR